MKKGLDIFKRKIEPYCYLAPTIILILVLLLIPIIMVISYSFYSNVIVVKDPTFVGLDNYKKILTDPEFIDAVKNTIFFVITSVFAHLVLGMFFALLLNTKYASNTTKAIYRLIYALPWMFTAAVIAILWKMMLNPNGVINYILMSIGLIDTHIEWLGNKNYALFAITFINIWAGYPFYMISILAGLQGISTDIYEASSIDGANGLKKFIYITIPQLKAILINLIILDIVWTMQTFELIWISSGGYVDTISTYIYRKGFQSSMYSEASAVACILLLICVGISVIYVKIQKED